MRPGVILLDASDLYRIYDLLLRCNGDVVDQALKILQSAEKRAEVPEVAIEDVVARVRAAIMSEATRVLHGEHERAVAVEKLSAAHSALTLR